MKCSQIICIEGTSVNLNLFSFVVIYKFPNIFTSFLWTHLLPVVTISLLLFLWPLPYTHSFNDQFSVSSLHRWQSWTRNKMMSSKIWRSSKPGIRSAWFWNPGKPKPATSAMFGKNKVLNILENIFLGFGRANNFTRARRAQEEQSALVYGMPQVLVKDIQWPDVLWLLLLMRRAPCQMQQNSG